MPGRVQRSVCLLLSLALAATWCLAFAPVSQWWLAPGLLAALGVWLLQSGVRSLLILFMLAWIAYTTGVHWLFISLYVYGGMPVIVAILAVVALAGYMACYPVLAVLLFRWCGCFVGKNAGSWRRVWQGFTWAACWSLAEYARATWLTGFPWLSLHDVWIDSPFKLLLPWIGGHAISILVLGSFTSLALLALDHQLVRRQRFGLIAGLACLLVAVPFAVVPFGNGLRQVGELPVMIVQPNIDQSIKFDPQRIIHNTHKTLALARSAMTSGQGEVAALMLPETALPVLWNEAPPPWRWSFQALADDFQVPVIMGVAIDDRDAQQRILRYTNSVVALYPRDPSQPERLADPSLEEVLRVPTARYDKRHLVPFGEMIPWGFEWFVAMMNMPLGEFTRGEGPPAAFSLGKGFHLLPNVCYEDAFSSELAAVVASGQPLPQVLLNVSNLAWFGRSWAMEQHAQLSRMRAAELGRAMIRATNTGVSGVALSDGRWLGRLPVATEASASFNVPMYEGMTAYMRWPDRAWWIATILILGLGLVVRRVKHPALPYGNAD